MEKIASKGNFSKKCCIFASFDALLKADIKKGLVRIEKTEIIGVDDKEYDL